MTTPLNKAISQARPVLLGTCLVLGFASASCRAQTAVTATPLVPAAPVASPVSLPEVPKPTPARAKEIAQHEADAIQGIVQTNDDWMYKGPYQLLSPSNPKGKGGTKTHITNLAHLMGNNSVSYYRFPWQGWQETVPASRIRNGLGINLNVSDAALPAALKQLKAIGMQYWRTDIGWGNGDYNAPDQLGAGFKKSIITRIALCKAAGIRPLFCLDTNPAKPCPMNEASVTVLAPVKAGDASILVKPRPGEVPVAWKSGPSHITQYWAAEYLATRVEKEGEGYRIHFAKTWPQGKDKKTGDTLDFAYLAFRPFGKDGSTLETQTYDGFMRFVKGVAAFLETQNLRVSATDPGYDIEFINENSNGHFFHLNWYAPGQADGSPERELYKRVVNQIRSKPSNDKLVLINGFYNQLPPQPGSNEPAGSNGGSSHFYQSAQVEKARRGGVEDAFGRDTKDGFIPSVIMHAPEVIFSAYKVENLGRNIAPIPQQMWGRVFGRDVQPRVPGKDSTRLFNSPIAKEPTGRLARPTRWYQTEWGDSAYGGTAEERYRKRAKYVSRGTVFALSKGIERIYWFAAADAGLGLLTEDASKLPDEEPLPVVVLKRLNALMNAGKTTKARQMPCVRISEKHGHKQFEGDGSVAFPDLYNRDILFTQSFQLSDTDLMACVYVPTLNYEQDLPEETYTIRWSGVKWGRGSKAAYCDLRDRQKKGIMPSAVGSDWVEFTLPVCDWPRFVILSGV